MVPRFKVFLVKFYCYLFHILTWTEELVATSVPCLCPAQSLGGWLNNPILLLHSNEN